MTDSLKKFVGQNGSEIPEDEVEDQCVEEEEPAPSSASAEANMEVAPPNPSVPITSSRGCGGKARDTGLK